MSPARARTRTARSGVEHTNHEATAPPTAWVAGEVLRECFCFGSEAMNASGDTVRWLVKSRVEFWPAQIRGVFWIMRFTSTHEFRIGWEYWKVNQNVNLYLSSFPGEKVCFHTQICKMYNAKKCIEEAFNWILGLSARKAEKFYWKEEQERAIKELISRNDSWVKWGWLACTTSKFYSSWHL